MDEPKMDALPEQLAYSQRHEGSTKVSLLVMNATEERANQNLGVLVNDGMFLTLWLPQLNMKHLKDSVNKKYKAQFAERPRDEIIHILSAKLQF